MALNVPDFLGHSIQRRCHHIVHRIGFVSFDKIWSPAVAAQQLLQLLACDAVEDGRIRDFVSVEMKDRENGPIENRIEEFVGMSARGQRSGLCFTIADDARHDQIRVVQRRSERMTEGVTQFAALVDRTRALRRGVTWNPSGE